MLDNQKNIPGNEPLHFSIEPLTPPDPPVFPDSPAPWASSEPPVSPRQEEREVQPQAPVTAGERTLWGILSTIAIVLVTVFCAVLFGSMALNVASPPKAVLSKPADVGILDRYDMYMTNQTSNALEGILSIKKSYWLNDDDLIAPEPNQECYGATNDPSSLQWLLDEAEGMLSVGDTTFSLDVEIQPGSQVLWYLDETIFVITWKQVIDNGIWTFSEIKIAHPSQFRRFLAGGEYGSDKQFVTTDMAASVNAVLASSGDFYKHRHQGVIVYDGIVQRVNSWNIDTCYIDDMGNMHFSRPGELTTVEEAQKFVDEHNIRFSIAFGPILIDNYQRCNPGTYLLGEIDDRFPRAALCQKGELHYVIIVSNQEGAHWQTPKLYEFAQHLEQYGFEKAYTLDGGQTAVIAMNDRLINPVHFGYQRQISDIFYFATAIPNGD